MYFNVLPNRAAAAEKTTNTSLLTFNAVWNEAQSKPADLPLSNLNCDCMSVVMKLRFIISCCFSYK